MTDATTTIRRTALNRAISMLEAAGATYAIQFEGETFGTLTIAEPKPVKQTRNRKYPPGADARAHYIPYLAPLKPGDAAEVPFGMFDGVSLARNISAYCVHAWGTGAAITQRNDKAQTVEVLRLF